MKWTTNPPDQAGWYFRKEVVHKANNRRVVSIVPIYSGDEGKKYIGVTDNATVTVYWSGPIPEPEDTDA